MEATYPIGVIFLPPTPHPSPDFPQTMVYETK